MAAPAAAQGSGTGDGVRVGVTLGGTGRYGLVLEAFSGANAVDVAVGTFRFGDLSVSVVGKRYLRSSRPNPYVGAGLWFVTSRPADARRGMATILRVPVGLDTRVTGRHHLGAEINVNRLLSVRRPDPADLRPVRGRIVPLPGFYYRFRG